MLNQIEKYHLVENDRIEHGGNRPYHLVINSENYNALRYLCDSYQGKVDCVYIDPPYNTGSHTWKYNNDYSDHDNWIDFMRHRLEIAKHLLNPDDSILICSINEKEYLRLGILLEQVFSGSKIQMITSCTNPQGSVRKGMFSRVEEYIYYVFIGSAKISDSHGDMLNDDNDTVQRWFQFIRTGKGNLRKDSKNLFYPIFYELDTGKITSIGDPLPLEQSTSSIAPPRGQGVIWPMTPDGKEARWRAGNVVARRRLEKGLIRLGRSSKKSNGWSVLTVNTGTEKKIEEGIIDIIGYDSNGSAMLSYDKPQLKPPKTIWNRSSHYAGGPYGSKLLSRMLPGRDFPYPKSLYAVEDCLRLAVKDKPNAIILDFFAGSGTTAHATMRLNHQDNGKRVSISITNNEVSKYDDKLLRGKGFLPGDKEYEKLGIAKYITWPRIVSAITGTDCNGNILKGNYGVTKEVFKEVDNENEFNSESILDKNTEKEGASTKQLNLFDSEVDMYGESSDTKDCSSKDIDKKFSHKGKLYRKVKIQDPIVPDPFPMAEGFNENAIFYDLITS